MTDYRRLIEKRGITIFDRGPGMSRRTGERWGLNCCYHDTFRTLADAWEWAEKRTVVRAARRKGRADGSGSCSQVLRPGRGLESGIPVSPCRSM